MNSRHADQAAPVGSPIKRGRKVPASQWAEIRTAYAAGIGLREMARKLGIPAGTVLARAKREHWTGQLQKARTLAGREMQSDAISVMQSAAMTMAERGKRHVERMAGVAEKVMPHVESMEAGAILDRIEDVDRLDKLARRTYGLEDGNRHGGISLTLNCLDPSMLREDVIEASVNAAS